LQLCYVTYRSSTFSLYLSLFLYELTDMYLRGYDMRILHTSPELGLFAKEPSRSFLQKSPMIWEYYTNLQISKLWMCVAYVLVFSFSMNWQTCMWEDTIWEYYTHLEICGCALPMCWCSALLISLSLWIDRHVFKRRWYENITHISRAVDVRCLCVGVRTSHLAFCLHTFTDTYSREDDMRIHTHLRAVYALQLCGGVRVFQLALCLYTFVHVYIHLYMCIYIYTCIYTSIHV